MTSIIASNLPESTTKQQVQKFFEFCGKIDRIDDSLQLSAYEGEKVFLVVFASSSALQTALLLNGAELNGAHVKIMEFSEAPGGGPVNAVSVNGPPAYVETPAQVDAKLEGKEVNAGNASINDAPGVVSSSHAGDIEQELKPKAQIFAEYLSHGYILGDSLLAKAIEHDKQNGYSEKFKRFLSDLNEKYALEAKQAELEKKQQQLDDKYGITAIMNKYYEKAMNTGVGSKLRGFYTDVVKDGNAIHEEAKRLAALKKQEAQGGEQAGAVSGNTDALKQ